MAGAPDFDPLLRDYARFRTGYPPEVYARILAAAPRRALRVLDVASGTGLAAEGLRGAAARVVACDLAPGMLRASPAGERARARAEALPFRGGAFDLLLCAQAFHWFQGAEALAEMRRVLRPDGLAAIWWKYEAAEDPVARLAERVVREVLGRDAPHTPLVRGGALPGLEGSGLRGEEQWVRSAAPSSAERYVGYQASREVLRRAAGPLRGEVLRRLGEELRALHGDAPFEVAQLTRLLLLRPGP